MIVGECVLYVKEIANSSSFVAYWFSIKNPPFQDLRLRKKSIFPDRSGLCFIFSHSEASPIRLIAKGSRAFYLDIFRVPSHLWLFTRSSIHILYSIGRVILLFKQLEQYVTYAIDQNLIDSLDMFRWSSLWFTLKFVILLLSKSIHWRLPKGIINSSPFKTSQIKLSFQGASQTNSYLPYG